MSQVLSGDDNESHRDAHGGLITAEGLASAGAGSTVDTRSPGLAITIPLGTPLSVAARALILSTLEHCGGERKRTAEMLGICTKTLYNRLREYGIREELNRARSNGGNRNEPPPAGPWPGTGAAQPEPHASDRA
jgi:DNA-binding NtrC family response regulator